MRRTRRFANMAVAAIAVAFSPVAATVARADIAPLGVFDKSHRGEPLDISGYKLAWEDGFDKLRVGRNGQKSAWYWGVHSPLVPGDKFAEVPDQAITVAGGVLKLETRFDTTDQTWVEAHIQTADDFGNQIGTRNGYFEASIALPQALGSHAGFWLRTQERGYGHGELDVVESYGFGDNVMHSSSHVWPNPVTLHQGTGNYPSKADLYSGFHRFGALVTEDMVTFYYDGTETGRIKRHDMQKDSLYVLLSVFRNPNQPVIQPATMYVDYVRIYVPRGK